MKSGQRKDAAARLSMPGARPDQLSGGRIRRSHRELFPSPVPRPQTPDAPRAAPRTETFHERHADPPSCRSSSVALHPTHLRHVYGGKCIRGETRDGASSWHSLSFRLEEPIHGRGHAVPVALLSDEL